MPTTDVERLVVSLEASITKYERAMRKALGQTNSTARRIENRYKKMGTAINASFARGFALLGGAAAIRAAQQLIDQSTRIENSLKVAGLAGEELTQVYDRLYASAQRNVAPLEALTQLFGRAALVQNELGISTEELLGFTDKVALALRVSGQSAEQSSGALLQLSQALGSGIVRAEEFNSILEGALPIAQAAAAGLEEAGGSVAKLRGLIVDGKVSSEAFFRAFEAGSVILEDKVAGAELTVSQGFIRLQNVLIDTAGKFNDSTNVSAELVGGLNDVGEAVQEFAAWLNDQGIPALRGLNEWAQTVEGSFEDLGRAISRATGGDKIGEAIVNSPFGQFFGLETLSSRADAANADRLREQRDRIRRAQIEDVVLPPREVQRVSLSDYELPDVPSTGTSPAEKFATSLQQQEERNRNLREMTALLTGLNPLVNDYGYAVEKLRVQQQLENDATAAGLALTPERRAAIEELAEGFAMATVEAEKLAEAQDEAQKSMREWFDVGRDLTRGFIDDLREGKSAAEALGNAFGKLGDKFLDLSLNSLFGGGGSDFGLLGALFGLGGGIGGGPINLLAAKGRVFSDGHLTKFANGGVVSRPTTFSYGGGTGLMGEAGDEAVMPLMRAPNGKLGVSAMGAGVNRVLIELGDGLVASVIEQAGVNSVQVVNARVPGMIRSGSPAAVARAQRNHKI